MHYGDLDLEIFSGTSIIPDPVELHITRETAGEYMILGMGKYGVLHFRVTELAGYSIWHTRFLIHEAMRLRVTADIPCTFLWIVWKNTLYYAINNGPEQKIMADYYNAYHLPKIAWELNFREPGEYETFNVLFTSSRQGDWHIIPMSIQFSHFFERARQGELTLLNPGHRRLTSSVRSVVADIIRGPVDLTNRHKFYEKKALALWFHVIRDLAESNLPPHTSFSAAEVAALYKLKDDINYHPEHNYQLKMLARNAGMNENKLESGFKSLFGKTVFGYILDQRMHLSSRLLKGGTYSIKEVAAKVGYKNTASFTHAFKRHFGFPPSHDKQ